MQKNQETVGKSVVFADANMFSGNKKFETGKPVYKKEQDSSIPERKKN